MVSGRVAIVTGGARGIGLGVARLLATAGVRVAIVSRDIERASGAVETLADPARHLAVQCDACDVESVRDCIGRVMGDIGPPTILVNNVGAVDNGLMISQSFEQFHDALQVNLSSSWIMSKYVLRHMIKQGRGDVVHIGSIIGLDGQAGQTAYSTAKAGLVGLTKSMAKEMGRRGIRVNCVAPGYIETEMTKSRTRLTEHHQRILLLTVPVDLSEELKTSLRSQTPLGRLGTVDDIANAVMFLISPQAAFITGQCLRVDGGLASPSIII